MSLSPEDPTKLRDGVSIGEASRRLGVPSPTLRSWERRYALPDAGRTNGGHRRYSVSSLVQLAMLRDEIALGRPPAEAVRAVRHRLDVASGTRSRVDPLLAAALASDTRAIGAALDRAEAELGLATTVDDVVLPALRQLGSWWETGRCDIGSERVAVGVIRTWLAKLTALAPYAGSAQVLVATGPQDTHTIGIEALAALLATAGIRCRVLGPEPSTQALLHALAAAPTTDVVVVSHLPSHRRSAVVSLEAVSTTGCRTWFAGNAFVLPRSRHGVAGTYLGESITGAAAMIRSGAPTTLPPTRLAPAV